MILFLDLSGNKCGYEHLTEHQCLLEHCLGNGGIDWELVCAGVTHQSAELWIGRQDCELVCVGITQ